MKIQQIESIVLQKLHTIEHPIYKKNLHSLNMFSHLELKENAKLHLLLKSPDQDKRVHIQLEAKLRSVLQSLELPYKFVIKFEFDESLKPKEQDNRIPNVKNLIAIGSGKGGVGKSTVAANLAVSLSLAGYKTGLIDCDIYGPSLGRMFGLNSRVNLGGDGKNAIYPKEVHGIKLISFSFMLNSDQAVVWRGPMLGKAVEQFFFQVMWGELDFLILDLPPGTGDVQLSMAQLTEVDGAILVTTPQNVALQDASRAAYMFLGVKIPVLGVVENMSAFHCPECGHVSHIFSKGGAKDLAKNLNVPYLGSIPLEVDIMTSGEEGTPIVLSQKDGTIAKAYQSLIESIPREVEKYR